MTEKAPTETELSALHGTTDADTDFPWPARIRNWANARAKADNHLRKMASLANALRVFETDDAADSIGVHAGRAVFNGTAYAYAGADPAVSSLANNDTTYVWAYITGGALAINSAIDATGWPAIPHIKLAEVTMAAAVITAILDRRPEMMLRSASQLVHLQTGGTWAIDGDGANTNGGGLVGDVTLTEQAAAYAVVDDGGAQALLSAAGAEAGYTANYQLFPDAEAINDAVYFGAAVPFPELALDMGTNGAYSGDAATWEYWNGAAWSALTLAQDNTDATAQDGLRPFQRDGAIHFLPPSDWASTTVNSQAGYWIRCRLTAATVTTAPITNSKEHELVTPSDGLAMHRDGLITTVRATDLTTGTIHTAADVIFHLQNFTTGAASASLTWAQDQRSDRWTGLTLAVAADDVVGVVVTQEDGTDEVISAALEIEMEPNP